MRYRLRTLLIFLAVAPPLVAGVYGILMVWLSYPPQVKEYKVPVSGGLRTTVPP